MSDSVRPHRRQPTRLLCPWDSPGKNTGVGCHFLLQCMKVKSESEVAQSCPTLCDPMDCSLPGSSVHGIFQARILEWGAITFSAGSQSSDSQVANREIQPRWYTLWWKRDSGHLIQNPLANAGDPRDKGSIPGSGRSPGEGIETHSSIPAWRIPWTEDHAGLQSNGLQRVGHSWSDLACTHRSYIYSAGGHGFCFPMRITGSSD